MRPPPPPDQHGPPPEPPDHEHGEWRQFFRHQHRPQHKFQWHGRFPDDQFGFGPGRPRPHGPMHQEHDVQFFMLDARPPFRDWHDPERRRFQHEHFRRLYRRRGRGLFWRFLAIFGLMALLAMAGVGVLVYLINSLLGGSGRAAMLVWITTCGLSLALPLMAAQVAMYAFRNIARPLGEVMSAADAVAEGDLTVRVTERRGQFGALTRSFNRMVGELERAEEQRRSLTADVAHELRTPLHILQGNLEGLIDGVYQPTSEHLHMMLDETRLLAHLVEDLRTLSLAESGQMALHKEDIPAADLLADVATNFSGAAESAGISLKTEAQSLNGTTVSVDPMRINQVLGNLVANALRFTPEGGAVTLSGAPIHSEDAQGVRLVVSDTGTGIAPDDLPHIFDRFWKADKARSRDAGSGSGLGLAIARQLVHLHGGRIDVRSEEGIGTTFVIELPA